MDYCSLARTGLAIRIFSISCNWRDYSHFTGNCSNNDNLQIINRKKSIKLYGSIYSKTSKFIFGGLFYFELLFLHFYL